VCIGAFVLSEFSQYLVESGKEPQKIFDTLNRHFPLVSEKAR
jgi:AP-2 complex subunit alpha